MPLPDSTPVIVAAARTPIGRAHAEKGCFRHVRGDELAVAAVRGLLQRAPVELEVIEDLLLGCANQAGEQGGNLGRIVALLAGLPFSCAGTTINRWCGSSLEALHTAAHAIAVGDKDVQIVAGVEHMGHLPMTGGLEIHPRLAAVTSKAALQMGLTAEFLAQSQNISRPDQDAFALRSHQRAAAAYARGDFAAEFVPVWGHSEAGERRLIDRDQSVRPDASLEKLAALPPAFVPVSGSVTAGNSSPLNDGAAALLVMSLGRARQLGFTQLLRVRATAVVGVEPCVMGTGPIAAVPKVLKRAGLKLSDFDVIELNEAFAAQALACVRGLKIDEARLNVRGGAIALGHPLGASGARIVTTLFHAMHAQDATLGLATMCIGLGQGIATVFERV